MKKLLNNERGLTLVELLAVLVIGAIILLLINNVHMFGQNQYNKQSKQAEQIYNVTYAAKVITNEIRKAEKIIVNEKVDTLTITISNLSKVFNQQNLPGISSFKVYFKGIDSRKLKIEIESTDQNSKKERIDTEIYVREGVSIERIPK